MIARESIQQVRNRADIVEVIGQFINLKRRGANYQANCPFHNEKSPSFNVNPARGIFKCFGCGKGGDVVSFIEEYEKFSFVEAIRWLANFYQIQLEETETTQEYKQQQQIEESLRVVNEYAAQYFEDILHSNEDGKNIGGSYFVERGFREHIIKQFKLGYCLDKQDAFAKDALAKGYNIEILEKAGLIKMRDGHARDNYRARVIFPIMSATGRIVGFGARILKKNENAPKYINTPENELYIKNKVLYGLYQSRQSISKASECLLVEGYTDVISLHQAGITNVVSSSGTSLTEGQLKLIGNLTKNLTILYDGDAAGVKAALRGLDMALAESFNVKLVLLPDGEDPDSFAQKSGEAFFRKYIDEHKQDVIEFRLNIGLKDAGDDPQKKSKLVNEIAETIAKINKVEDFSLQQHYIRKCSQLLNIDEEGLINLVNKTVRDQIQIHKRSQQREEAAAQANATLEQTQQVPQDNDSSNSFILANPATEHKEEWQLVRLLLEYGDKPYPEYQHVASAIFETIDIDIFEQALAQKIAQTYFDYMELHQQLPDINMFITNEDKDIKIKSAELLLQNTSPSSNWLEKYKIDIAFGEKNYIAEVQNSLAFFELKYIRKIMLQNMKNLETETNPEKVIAMMKAHKQLKDRESTLLQIAIMK